MKYRIKHITMQNTFVARKLMNIMFCHLLKERDFYMQSQLTIRIPVLFKIKFALLMAL